MSRISLTLSRTVFLPVGSPPIGSVCDIRADIGKADIHVENGQIYCLGDLDILIDYMSFSPGGIGQLYTGHSTDQQSGEGREWQALLNLPFVMNEKTELAPDRAYEAAVGDLKWFMVAPRALEMEIQLFITEEQSAAEVAGAGGVTAKKRGGGWQMMNEEEREQAIAAGIPFDEEELPGPAEGMFDGEMMTQIVAGFSPTPEFPPEPEIVRIVFNEDAPIDEEGIKRAIAQAKAELAIKRAAQAGFSETVAVSPPAQPFAPVEQAAPSATRKARRSHGLPQLNIDAQNNDIDFTALNFNINVKIP
jgi:hypothetical protein